MLVMQAFGRVLVLEPYLADRRAGRHRAERRRIGGPEAGAAAGDRRGQPEAGLRARRTAGALRPDRCRDDREAQRLAAGCWTDRRRSFRMARRRTRSLSAPAPAATATTKTASRCSWSMRRRRAWRGAATSAAMTRGRRIFRLSNVSVTEADVLGEVGKGLPIIQRVDRGRHRRHRRRNGRRDGSDERNDAGIQQDPRAVRQADRIVSGGAAPAGRHVHGAGARPQHGDAGDDVDRQPGRRRPGARYRDGEGGRSARPAGMCRKAPCRCMAASA